MTVSTIFSNATKHLPAMRIIMDVGLKLAGNECLAAVCIKAAITKGMPYLLIVQTIAEMATDNYNMVADLIGIELTDKCMAL